MQFGLAPHSGTIFWMRELRSSGQTKVQRMLNVPERLMVSLVADFEALPYQVTN
jgi:hypothetical protein